MEKMENLKLTTTSVDPISAENEKKSSTKHGSMVIDEEMKESRKLFGRSIKPPIEICSRNLPRPMFPLMLYLCFYCQKSSSERDCFITDAGRVFFSVQLCPKCIEFNKSMQDAGSIVLQRHLAEQEMMACKI